MVEETRLISEKHQFADEKLMAIEKRVKLEMTPVLLNHFFFTVFISLTFALINCKVIVTSVKQ